MLTKAPRGTKDITPKDAYKWNYVENKFREICSLFGYEEMRTPVFEHTELFKRSVGDTTDIVQKEMYSFTDKGGRDITLKPEGTAGVVRAFIENKLYADTQPTKLFYITPCFRYERPQAGRQRQFHQFGIEALGSDKPSLDAEVIALAVQFFTEVGLKDLAVSINSVGCPTCRAEYNARLKEYLDNENIKYNNIDGIRIDYEDGFTLIRQSNTGPVLTVRFERKDEESLEKEKQKYLDLIKKISLEIN